MDSVSYVVLVGVVVALGAIWWVVHVIGKAMARADREAQDYSVNAPRPEEEL